MFQADHCVSLPDMLLIGYLEACKFCMIDLKKYSELRVHDKQLSIWRDTDKFQMVEWNIVEVITTVDFDFVKFVIQL